MPVELEEVVAFLDERMKQYQSILVARYNAALTELIRLRLDECRDVLESLIARFRR